MGDAQQRSVPLDPFSRRLLQIAGLLACLVILVALNSVLRDGGESPFSPNPIAAAAAKTQREPGSRMTMSAVYSSPALSGGMTMTGSGAFNGLSGRSEVAMRLQAPAPVGTVEMDMVAGDGVAYVRSPLFGSSLPAGKEWLAFDPQLADSTEAALAGGGDPRSQLEMLEEVSGTVVTIGSEDVRGVETTRYRGTIDLSQFADALREQGNDEVADAYDELSDQPSGGASVEAWIDRKGLLRQMRMVMSLPTGSGTPALSMDIRMEFFDYGAKPQIELPDPAVVLDATALVEAAT
jgi:hypothetical protein